MKPCAMRAYGCEIDDRIEQRQDSFLGYEHPVQFTSDVCVALHP